MAYRKLKADYLFTGDELLDKQHVLIIDEKRVVEDIVTEEEAGEDIEVLQGIISPGLINCHCHLELSHLKNVIPPHTGLIEFLCSVVTKRDFAPEIIASAIKKAEKEMYNNGIVAVGDIGNTLDTENVKTQSNIYWQNFVEVLSFTDEKSEENIHHYTQLLSQWQKTNSAHQRSSLVPHSPYSISPKTFKLINEATKDQVISVHNQEHPAEDELYKTGNGEHLKLFKIFGVNSSPFPITGKTSLRSWLPHFNNGQTIFLIHNTYTTEEDVVFANSYAKENNITLIYCLCPNANLYIENKMPPVEMLMKHNCDIVLGTDSYSSNWQLSIIKEVAAIQEHFPKIPLNTILQWATSNGAKALKWDKMLGSFEKGKQPGGVIIQEKLNLSKKIF